MRQAFVAGDRHDVDVIMAFHAPKAVWDLSDQGRGKFGGVAAIGGWVEDWSTTPDPVGACVAFGRGVERA